MNYEIREMTTADLPQVMAIFQQGIDSGIATFDVFLPSENEFSDSFLPNCRWVLENALQMVVGWVALKPTSNRACFSGVAEISIYLDKNHTGKGLGKLLMNKIIADSELNGIWTLQANIFPENEMSIAFHLSNGFMKIGIRRKIGKLHGVWKDLVLLERRSPLL